MTDLIIVGGFLGAGKTTLLGQTAKVMAQKNKKTGLITNDQASELVDTIFLEQTDSAVSEVSGSCFCCNYNGFADALHSVKAQGAQVIIAEPVGSCTDLSATIMQPLKEQLSGEFKIAPLSVLADPKRLEDILDGKDSGLHKSAAYIVKKQMEEADYIVINKIDLISEEKTEELKKRTKEAFPKAKVMAVSALSGQGIEEWLDALSGDKNVGTHITDVDYDTYAEGEAVLGWLNTTITLKGSTDSWKGWMTRMMTSLKDRLDKENMAVGHVKAMLDDKKVYLMANLTGTGQEVVIRGDEPTGEEIRFTLNARAETTPDALQQTVTEELEINTKNAGITYEVAVLNCLQPGRPNPTWRYDKTVEM
ncbi:MAG: GTP-binding protein [Lachnospiraceae bacterium]|nr:GTP-binding protein [Lachnospiraceae bacterium]